MRRSGISGANEERRGDDTAPLGTRVVPADEPADGDGPGQDQQHEPDARTAKGARAARSGRRGKKPPKPRWRRVLVWTAGSLAFLVAAVAVAGWLYIRHLNGNIEKAELNLGDSQLDRAEPNAAGQTPLNILLLGSDSRDGEENQDLGGARDLAGGAHRADTQMLLHASADRSNITLISVPRDTQVTIPRCTDPETGEVYPEELSASINTSLSHGGPGCTVATWEALTGIPIDHFMMVDFAGVVDMADAVGGVPVCVQDNVYDEDSGLRLEAGDHILEGEEALQWLRTRHGFSNGSDVDRTRAQQMYLSNMAHELQEGTSLTNPGQLMDLAEAATNALVVDHGIGTVNKLYDLGEDLRRVPSDRINSITMPWLPDPEDPEVTVIPDPVEAEALFSLVREDSALDEPAGDGDDQQGGENADDAEPTEAADPAEQIAITVRNATGYDGLPPVDGRAADITDQLYQLGFTAAATDETLGSEAASSVLYPTEADRPNAEAVATALGLPASAVRVSPTEVGITLVIGADWREGTSYPEQSDDGSAETGGSGGGGAALDPEDVHSGEDNRNDCMAVNPYYTW
ncbi:LCP family protein [Streptomyces sp. B6B3]|uniref:LCP family protein n=1 Tax=Streptomyces sp. B6B3 TaxID=3153570 RepID=UPI00325D9736